MWRTSKAKLALALAASGLGVASAEGAALAATIQVRLNAVGPFVPHVLEDGQYTPVRLSLTPGDVHTFGAGRYTGTASARDRAH